MEDSLHNWIQCTRLPVFIHKRYCLIEKTKLLNFDSNCFNFKGDDFLLRMKLIDHIYDDQYIESATIRIILPEHST